MQKHMLFTRRDFIGRMILGGSVASTVPTFIANTLFALQAKALEQPTKVVTGRDGPILVLLQMAGGNDGLNTVVPYLNDDYYRARPRLAIPAVQF